MDKQQWWGVCFVARFSNRNMERHVTTLQASGTTVETVTLKDHTRRYLSLQA